MSIEYANIKINCPLPMRGIYYIGQYGTSGYATAAKGYLYHYFSLGVPITWEPLYFDDSRLEEDNPYNIIVKSLINKRIDHYDVVMMHSTPDLWPKFRAEKNSMMDGKIVIGYCTWETNKLAESWVKCINNTVNEVWVPSQYNKDAFISSGVKRTIRVVPHIFLHTPLPEKSNIQILDSEDKIIDNTDKYTFYAIGELNARKGIDDLLKSFCEEFSLTDNVRLILKLHYRDYSNENRIKCKEMVNRIIQDYSDAPEIICILNNLSDKELISLHSIGDCYVSLSKSEGFGLTIFDAYNYKKNMIVTGYGGHLDFLGKEYPGLVNYSIGPVRGMESDNYGSDQEWAYPDLNHVKTLMRGMYAKHKI